MIGLLEIFALAEGFAHHEGAIRVRHAGGNCVVDGARSVVIFFLGDQGAGAGKGLQAFRVHGLFFWSVGGRWYELRMFQRGENFCVGARGLDQRAVRVIGLERDAKLRQARRDVFRQRRAGDKRHQSALGDRLGRYSRRRLKRAKAVGDLSYHQHDDGSDSQDKRDTTAHAAPLWMSSV